MTKMMFTTLLVLTTAMLFGQNFIGVSCRYDYLSKTEISNKSNIETESLIRTIGVAYPLIFNEGKLIILNKVEHIDVEMEYHNSEIDPIMDLMQIYKYKLVVLNQFTEKWKFMGVVTPGLSSDFKSDVSKRDFICEFQAGFHKMITDKLELGGGVTGMYETMTDQTPLPYVWIDWKPTEKIWLLANLPGMLDLNYKFNDYLDTSTMYNFIYERYSGKKDFYYDDTDQTIPDPLIQRSCAMISQKINLNIGQWVHLSVEGGVTLLGEMNFGNKGDIVLTLEQEPNYFLSSTFTLGM